MERRFGSSRLVSVLWSYLTVVSLITGSFGCARDRAAASSFQGNDSGAAELLDQARQFSARGESHRAEQYFLAALEAGADPDATYPELIDACIRGGRLGSASVHVDGRLREQPSDLKLLRLAISLEEGLGHERKALARAESLERSPRLTSDQQLFLAGFFQRADQTGRALVLFRAYLERTVPSARAPWVADAVSRLEQTSPKVESQIQLATEEASHE